MEKKTGKNGAISCIRMVSTLMIVLLHILQRISTEKFGVITDWINLSLVMFCCISGFLYSRRTIPDTGKWYLHRYKEIAIPSMLVGLVTVIVFALMGEMDGSKAINSLLSCLGLQVLVPDSWMFIQLWFLSYLLVFYVTVPIFQKLDIQKMSDLKFWTLIAGATVILQIVFAVLERLLKIPFLSVGILLRFYLPYFVFKRYDIADRGLRKIMYLLTALSVVAIAVICYVRYFMQADSLGGLAELMFVYTQSLVGFVLFYWIYTASKGIKADNKILRISDKLSYPVYLTHCLFIGYNTSAMYWVDNLFVGIILALVLTVVASVTLYYLTNGIKKLCFR